MRLAHHLAIASDLIRGDCIEANEFPDLSQRYMVMAVPKTVINERAVAYGVERQPAIVVEGAKDYGIRFFGVPMGYEFSNLIDSMLAVSSGAPQLSAASLERLQGLTEPVHLQVFATPT